MRRVCESEPNAQPDDAWLKCSKEAFDQAVLIDPKAASAYYFMGECYLARSDLEAAGRMFSRVLDLNREYVDRGRRPLEAGAEDPAGHAGDRDGEEDRPGRTDHPGGCGGPAHGGAEDRRPLRRRTPKTFDAPFKDSEKARTQAARPATAADIAGHPLRTDIEGIIRIGMRGLDVYPDGTFRPDEPVDRASYAMMIEDILIKVTGTRRWRRGSSAAPSPFPICGPIFPISTR